MQAVDLCLLGIHCLFIYSNPAKKVTVPSYCFVFDTSGKVLRKGDTGILDGKRTPFCSFILGTQDKNRGQGMGDIAYHYITTKAPALSRNAPASDSYKKIKK